MATKAQVRQMLKDGLKKLEEARREMVFTENDFNAEDVHAVALAQFETGKAIERLDPQRRIKR
jgi:hypothetical protein